MNGSVTAGMAVVVAALWMQAVNAQEEATRALPVEFYSCNFVEGKGMKDLDKVIEKFDRWSTRHSPKYSAWTLTPQYHNSQSMFQLGWLGSWPDGKAYGKSQDAWKANGAELGEAFADVIDCSLGHELASSVVVHAPLGPPGDGVVLFYACKLAEGKTHSDAFGAQQQLAQAMKALGSKGLTWLFYPGLGSANDGVDYWRVTTFNNYTELGEAAEAFTNAGGWRKSQEILAGIAMCGSPSVYDARQVRAGITREKL